MAIEEKIIIFREIINQFEKDFYPDISEAVISFTNIKDESKFIYDGHEKKNFLDNSFNTEDNFIKSEIQKKRFGLLSKLVTDLFNCKNSVVCFHNISNLIVLILNIYNEKFPVDLYSNGEAKSIKKSRDDFKHIIKENLL